MELPRIPTSYAAALASAATTVATAAGVSAVPAEKKKRKPDFPVRKQDSELTETIVPSKKRKFFQLFQWCHSASDNTAAKKSKKKSSTGHKKSPSATTTTKPKMKPKLKGKKKKKILPGDGQKYFWWRGSFRRFETTLIDVQWTFTKVETRIACRYEGTGFLPSRLKPQVEKTDSRPAYQSGSYLLKGSQ